MKFEKKHGVVAGRIGLFIFCVFSSHDVFLVSLGVASALFRDTELVSR